MKLESLKNNPKFNIIADDIQFNAIGGKLYLTRKSGSTEITDCWDDGSTKDVATTVASNGTGDAYDQCPTGTSAIAI